MWEIETILTFYWLIDIWWFHTRCGRGAFHTNTNVSPIDGDATTSSPRAYATWRCHALLICHHAWLGSTADCWRWNAKNNEWTVRWRELARLSGVVKRVSEPAGHPSRYFMFRQKTSSLDRACIWLRLIVIQITLNLDNNDKNENSKDDEMELN